MLYLLSSHEYLDKKSNLIDIYLQFKGKFNDFLRTQCLDTIDRKPWIDAIGHNLNNHRNTKVSSYKMNA